MGSKDIPRILDGKFFIISVRDPAGNVSAKCCTCSKDLKGSLRTTSNFNTHLQLKHPDKHKEYQQYMNTGVLVKKPKSYPFPVVARSSHSQLKADGIILDYVVNTMQPLSAVENKHFKRVITELPKINAEVKAPAVKTLLTRMKERYNNKTAALVNQFLKIDYVSATTDIWSSNHKSYLGVTCHWIDMEDPNFKRCSAALALKRFRGRHTADKITDLLIDVFDSFGIREKITTVVTDNGSNFIKAFQEYGCVFRYDPIILTEGEEEDDDDEGQSDPEEISDNEVNSRDYEPVVQDATLTLDESSVLARLPPHSRCASHTLSLVATTDMEKELEIKVPRNDKRQTSSKQVLRSTMAKCSAFWNKCSRSNLVPELIKDETGSSPKTPCRTRWNSTYDCITHLVNHFDKLDRMFEIADVPVLKSVEKEFVRAYHSGMSPVAWTLDKLQAEKNLFFGSICPAIHKCKAKLQSLINDDDSFESYIASALHVGLQNRFRGVLEVSLADSFREIMASVSLPFAKLWWVPENKQEEIKQAFIAEAKKINPSSTSHLEVEEIPGGSNNEMDDLFEFNQPQPGINAEDAELECIRYLKDSDTKLLSLRNYPRILKLFVKFNTTLPSSAPAERMFSYGKMIQRPQRSRLGDDNFEQLVFLKMNA